jgi:hypothetical protein
MTQQLPPNSLVCRTMGILAFKGMDRPFRTCLDFVVCFEAVRHDKLKEMNLDKVQKMSQQGRRGKPRHGREAKPRHGRRDEPRRGREGKPRHCRRDEPRRGREGKPRQYIYFFFGRENFFDFPAKIVREAWFV